MRTFGTQASGDAEEAHSERLRPLVPVCSRLMLPRHFTPVVLTSRRGAFNRLAHDLLLAIGVNERRAKLLLRASPGWLGQS